MCTVFTSVEAKGKEDTDGDAPSNLHFPVKENKVIY